MESPEAPRRTHESGWTGLVPPRTIERKRKGRGVDVISGLPTPPSTARRGLPTPPSTKRARKARHDDSTQIGLPTPQTLPRKRTLSAVEGVEAQEEEEEGKTPEWDNTFFSSFTTSRQSAAVPRRRPGLTFAQQMGLLAPSRQGAGVGMGGNRLGHAFGHRPDEMMFSADSALLAAPADLDLAHPSGEDNPFFVPSTHPTSSPVIRRPLAEVNLPAPSSSDNEMMPSTPPFKPLNFLATDLSPPRNAAIRDINKSLDQSAQKHKRDEEKEAKRRRKEELRRMMDEDDNPFLQKLGEGSVTAGKHAQVDESKPYVTYVFRGAKKVFANPWLAGPAPPATEDDEEEQGNPAPRLLWSKAPTRTAQDQATEDDDTDDNEGGPSTPLHTASRKVATRFAELDPTEEFALRGTSRAFSSTHSIEDLDSPGEPDPPVRRGLLFAPARGNGTTS